MAYEEKQKRKWKLTPREREEFRRRLKAALEKRGESFPEPLEKKSNKSIRDNNENQRGKNEVKTGNSA